MLGLYVSSRGSFGTVLLARALKPQDAQQASVNDKRRIAAIRALSSTEVAPPGITPTSAMMLHHGFSQLSTFDGLLLLESYRTSFTNEACAFTPLK
eukprot:3204210-Amphidinium_carterae.1